MPCLLQEYLLKPQELRRASHRTIREHGTPAQAALVKKLGSERRLPIGCCLHQAAALVWLPALPIGFCLRSSPALVWSPARLPTGPCAL